MRKDYKKIEKYKPSKTQETKKKIYFVGQEESAKILANYKYQK